MNDRYIDYFEVDEYGTHFVQTAKSLIGACPLVDVQALINEVDTKTKAVNTELKKAGIQRSALRGEAGDVEHQAKKAGEELGRFWSFLNSLDEGIALDRQAFFQGDKQGAIAKLKPADLKARIVQVLIGFSAEANKNLPDASKWQNKLEAARDGLGGALDSTGGAKGEVIQAGTALRNAREAFLTAYNGVAKRLILGLLVWLGRKDEYVYFFKDMQLSEGRSKGEAPAGDSGGKAEP